MASRGAAAAGANSTFVKAMGNRASVENARLVRPGRRRSLAPNGSAVCRKRREGRMEAACSLIAL